MSEPTKQPLPLPKYEVGQIVIMKGKRNLPFRILGRIFETGEWFYQWNRKNYSAEHMIRGLSEHEVGHEHRSPYAATLNLLVGVEYGYKQCEKGNNIQAAISNAKKELQ